MSTQTAQVTDATLANTVTEDSAFADLLAKEFKPRTDEQRSAVESAVRTLAEQALESSLNFSGDAYRSIQAIIGEIDRKLSEQIDHIVHHSDFQQLESSWRGLHYLVNNTETDHEPVEKRPAPHPAPPQGRGLGPKPAVSPHL